MKFKHIFLLFGIIMCTAFFNDANAQFQNLQDVVYLKNGSIIRGMIIEQTPNVSLKIKTRDNNVFVYSYDEILKMTKEANTSYNVNPSLKYQTKRQPGLAFLWSFLLPGGGQYYNKQYGKGAVMTGIYVGSIIGLLTTDQYSYDDYYYKDESTNTTYTIFTITLLANSLWSMIDAPISAGNINRKHQLGLNYNLGKKTNLSVRPDYSICSKGLARPTGVLGAKLSLTIN
jgi:TM2 domain-containing membrane protein YozV